MSSIPLSNEKISFTASLQEGWSGGQGSGDKSRAVKPDFPGLAREQKVLTTDEAFSKPLYLHPIETVNKILKNQGPTTRGIMNTSTVVDNFRVSANYIQNEGSKKEESFFQDREAKKEGSNNNWFVADNVKWPAAGTVSFYAYAPYNYNNVSSLKWMGVDDVTQNKTIHYEVPENVEDQPDFIVAKSEGKSFTSSSANTPVDLQFSHALTAITFSVSDDMEKGVINSITIEGVKGEGDYNLSTKEWSVSSSSASYNVPISAGGLTVGTGTVNLAPDATLMMIPQTLGDGAKVTINITPTDKKTVDLAFYLKDTQWLAGNHVTYLLSTTKIIKLNMGSVTYPHWQTADGSPFTSKKLKDSYANGDELGMYIVDKNHKVVKANVQLTTTDGKNWNFSSLQKFTGSLSYDYFLYYPYQADGLAGAPREGDPVSVNSVTNQISASDFFSGAITEWGKKFDTSSGNIIDQSDPEKMNSFDLQIGKADDLGESGTTINFSSMKHAMALAEIKLGIKTISKFTNYLPGYDATNSSNTYEWKVTVGARASSNIKGYNMYKTADYSYVSIVKPGNTTFNSVQEESDVNRWKQELSFENLASNTYASKEAESQQEGNPNKREPYTVALGDVYYSDGSISHYKDELLYGKIPVGVVVYIPEATGVDYWAERGSISDKPYIGGHGLVLALKTVGSTGDDTRMNYGSNFYWWTTNSGNQTGCQSTSLSYHLNSQKNVCGSGYYLSNKIGNNSQVVSAAKGYKPSYGSKSSVSLTDNATSKCTGWFVPSIGQIYAAVNANCGGVTNAGSLAWGHPNVFRNSNGTNVTETINKYLCKASGANSLSEASPNYTYFSHEAKYHWIWVSSEYDSMCAGCVVFGTVGVGSLFVSYAYKGNGKNNSDCLRPFLAF